MRMIIGTVMIFASVFMLMGLVHPEDMWLGALCIFGIMIGTILQVVT